MAPAPRQSGALRSLRVGAPTHARFTASRPHAAAGKRVAATPAKGPDAASARLCVGAARDAKGAAALAEEFGERRRGR